MPGHHVGHRLVHPLGSQAAAKGEDAELSLRHAALPAGLLPALGKYLRAHRIAGDYALPRRLLGEIFLGLLHRQQHLIHLFCQELGGDAGESILLMGGGGDAHFCRCQQNGAADISSGAHHKVRPKGPNHLLGPRLRRQQQTDGLRVPVDVIGGKPSLDAHGPKGDKLEPGPRHQTGLHPIRITGEANLYIRAAAAQGGGDGEAGVNMPRCPPAGKQDLHITSLLFQSGLSGY